MTAIAGVSQIVRPFTSDDPPPGDIRLLHGSAAGPRIALQVRRPGGGSWIIRGVRRDQPIPASMPGCAVPDSRAWLHSSRHGEVIENIGDWWICAHTYIDGTPIRPTHDQLSQLGYTLGRLHHLAWNPEDPATRIGRSSWHPDAAIPATLESLTAAGPLLPPPWRDTHARLKRSVQTISAYRTELPETITHADAWPANGIQTTPADVTLIDWDTGGAGPALADLGRCLLECHLDTGTPAGDPAAWHIRPDPARITALVTGYRRERTPTAIELELLQAGIEYGIAFIAAIHLNQALHHGVHGPHMDNRWNRIRNRLAASTDIAAMAARAFTRPGP